MSKSVIIIGAGMAGIKTAIDLYNAGELNTIILEARDRVGGRLVSKQSTLNPKVCYDLGALWFHDGLTNPLFKKAKKLGNIDYFFDDGEHRYLSETDKSIPNWVFDKILPEIEAFGQLLYMNDPERPDMTLKDVCLLYLKEHGNELLPDTRKYAIQVVRLWTELWDGISWDQASAKHSFIWGFDHFGRNAYVKNGYRTVFQNELDELPRWYQENNILLEKQVTKIDYSNPDLVSVTVSDGSVYTANYVVVTAPASVLRIVDPADQYYIDWAPSLPLHITSFWPETEYGSLGKVVFEFDHCFWPESVQRFYVLASGVESSGSAKPWQHPTIVVNYRAMSDVPSLVCLTQDPLSKQIERLTKQEIWALFEPVIKQFATGPVQEPFNIINTEWNSDPLLRGSYSAGRLNSRSTDDFCAVLANGVTKRVRFAGAETIAGSSNGCADGAWYSGEREALFILRDLKVKNKL